MIYDYKNAVGAKVIDVVTGKALSGVVSVNLDTRTVTRQRAPLQIVDYTVSTFDKQYESINMVFDSKTGLLVFHCHRKF